MLTGDCELRVEVTGDNWQTFVELFPRIFLLNMCNLPNLSLCDNVADETIPYEPSVVFTCIIIVEGLLIATVNIIFIVAFVKTSALKEEPANKLVVNLAVAHLITALQLLSLQHLRYIITQYKEICLFLLLLSSIGLLQSQFSVIFINLDRFVAVTRPLHYHQIVTEARVRTANAASWVTVSILSILFVFRNHWQAGRTCIIEHVIAHEAFSAFIFTFYGAAVFVTCVYLHLFKVARRHQRRIQADFALQSSATGVKFTKQLRLAKMFSSVFVAYIVCCTPFFVIVTLNFFGIQTTPWLREISNLIICSYAYVDFFIYVCKNRTMRRACQSVLKCSFK